MSAESEETRADHSGVWSEKADELRRAAAEKEAEKERARKAEWEGLLLRGQRGMSDAEKLLFAQLQIMTKLLSEIADGVNKSNNIASAPRYGFGVGGFFPFGTDEEE